MAQVAVVTGGGRGIGAAIAVALASSGFDVAVLSKEPESAVVDVIARVRERGRRVLYLEADIADIERHGTVLDRVYGALGAVDCLVNNAGVTSLQRGDLLEVTRESFDRSIDINLRGTFFLTQAIARAMMHTASTAYRSIVTITSANAEIIGVDRADYCMTKAALSMMSKLYAARLAPSNIHVFEIRPGIIRTEMTRPAIVKYDDFIARDGVPMKRWGVPEDVAATVASIAEGRLPFATGEVINVGGGLHLKRV